MREIKFKAWSERGMVPAGSMSYWLQAARETGVLPDFTKVTLLQYTGLKDKFGEEIYEGDIVKDAEGNMSQVVFDTGSFVVQHEPLRRRSFDFIAEKNYFEVVGNIYQNKELLK